MTRNREYTLEGAQTQILMNGGYYPNFSSKATYEYQPVDLYYNFVRQDVVKNPDWFRRKLLSVPFAAPSPYHHSRIRNYTTKGVTKGHSIGHILINSGTIGHVGGTPSMSLTSLPDGDRAYNSSILKALEKLKDQDVNVANMLGEAARTAQLVGQTAASLGSAVSNLRKGHISSMLNDLKVPSRGVKNIPPPSGADIPKRWLEYQYGWKPLLGDVHGLTKSFADRYSSPKAFLVNVRGYSKEEDLLSISSSNELYDYNEFQKTDVRCNTSLYYQLSDNLELMKASKLGLINPFSVAWELVPFSFMVDWFVPIGGVLNVLDADAPYSFIGGHTTTVLVSETQAFTKLHGENLEGRVFEKRDHYTYVRRPHAYTPRPRLYYKGGTKPATSANHVANFLAIIASAFS